MKAITFFSTLCALLYLHPGTQFASGASLEAAEELYIKSGLEKQMQDIGPAIQDSYTRNYSLTERHTSREKKIYEQIGNVTEESFDAREMRETVLNGISKDIHEEDMRHILYWLDSAVGKKITRLEEMASSSEGVRKSQEFIANIKNISVPKNRIHLIKELNSSMNLTETTVEIALATQFALSMTTKNGKRGASIEDIERAYAIFSNNRGRLEPVLRQQVHGSLLYTYQDLSDDELAEYVNFVNSDSGKNYTAVTSRYMLQAITGSSMKFAMKISQL